MGFMLGKDVLEAASEIALTMGQSDEAVPIPGSPNMTLVRMGSKAFLEKKAAKGGLMIPVKQKAVKDGIEVEEYFAVCIG